jgi:hypothetical protein
MESKWHVNGISMVCKWLYAVGVSNMGDPQVTMVTMVKMVS